MTLLPGQRFPLIHAIDDDRVSIMPLALRSGESKEDQQDPPSKLTHVLGPETVFQPGVDWYLADGGWLVVGRVVVGCQLAEGWIVRCQFGLMEKMEHM